jgi:hypothetical protein
MADKFKCPKCSSGRTKPLSIAIAGGTRRRQTVGFSRRSLWTSTNTDKSELVSSLPTCPSNNTSYSLIFLGVCGLILASFVGSGSNATGFTVFIAVVSILFLLIGLGSKKSLGQLAEQQSSWDSTWFCARCGHKWQG